MSFSTFFSKQARKPTGVFGRWVMSLIFDRGNAFLNDYVFDLMSVQADDRIIEIGCGTGKLISRMAAIIEEGIIEGIDFSGEMISTAIKQNKKFMVNRKVKIVEGDFDNMDYEKKIFTKACSVNTLYFWPRPEYTVKKIADLLTPSGKLILAFEDIGQLNQRNLDHDVFRFYAEDDVRNLLIDAGFSDKTNIVSRKKGKLTFHCAVGMK